MRNILYTLGALVTLIGIAMTYTQLPDFAPSQPAIVVGAMATIALQRMLIVVCGVLLLVGGAIVGAVEGLRAPQWQPPVQGPPMQ